MAVGRSDLVAGSQLAAACCSLVLPCHMRALCVRPWWVWVRVRTWVGVGVGGCGRWRWSQPTKSIKTQHQVVGVLDDISDMSESPRSNKDFIWLCDGSCYFFFSFFS